MCSIISAALCNLLLFFLQSTEKCFGDTFRFEQTLPSILFISRKQRSQNIIRQNGSVEMMVKKRNNENHLLKINSCTYERKMRREKNKQARHTSRKVTCLQRRLAPKKIHFFNSLLVILIKLFYIHSIHAHFELWHAIAEFHSFFFLLTSHIASAK